MLFKNLFNKNKQEKVETIGDGFPFKLLNEETMTYSEDKKWKVLRNNNGKKYWEYLKPYEIIDGNLCVRICNIFHCSNHGGWIVLSKEELEDILSKM